MKSLNKVENSQRKELNFSEMLTKTYRRTRAKTFKVANRYENIEQAKQEVLKILDSQRNPDGYYKEYKEHFVISVDGVKYHQISNNKFGLTKNESNRDFKMLYLSNSSVEQVTISIAELVNKYNKKEVKFLEYKNTRLGDIYTQIIL